MPAFRRSINKRGANEKRACLSNVLVLIVSYLQRQGIPPPQLDQAFSSHPFPNIHNSTVKMMKTDLYNITNGVIKAMESNSLTKFRKGR